MAPRPLKTKTNKAFNVLVAYVKDLPSSLHFYCDLLGFKQTREMPPGLLLYQEESDVTLYLQTATDLQKPEIAVCFNIAKGVTKCSELLKEQHIEIVDQYGSADSDFAGVQFRDPCGNLIEIAGRP